MDDLVTAIGLLLTQLRYSRRALEDIERSTARYGSFAFVSALTEGPKFGAPPMLSGALKVHVVNINDLAPGSGFGGFLESLIGGVGRFFGGFLGGFAGGVIGGVALPVIIIGMRDLAARIERILTLLGISFKDDDKDKKKDPQAPLLKRLEDVITLVNLFTGLFQAAGSKPAGGRDVPAPNPLWVPLLERAKALMLDISRVVAGLIILIPILIGALAWVVVHLRAIQLAVIELMQFLLKQQLLLRGIVLFTLWDSIAGAAHVAANVLSMLGEAVPDIIKSISEIFQKIFAAGIEVLKFLADGLKQSVDSLLRWVVDAIGAVLIAIGNSKVFRVVTHLIQILPAVLPGLVMLVTDKPVPNLSALSEAATKSIEAQPAFSGTGKPKQTLPELPDILGPTKDALEKSSETLTKALTQAQTDLKTGFDKSVGALNKIGNMLDEVKKDQPFLKGLDSKEAELRKRSETFASSLEKSEIELAKRPDTGLEQIAAAYEKWLKEGGLNKVLDSVGTYLKNDSAAGAFGPPAAFAAPDTRPPATVEIREVIIDLGSVVTETGAPAGNAAKQSFEQGDPEHMSPHDEELELQARCQTLVPGAALMWSSRSARHG